MCLHVYPFNVNKTTGWRPHIRLIKVKKKKNEMSIQFNINLNFDMSNFHKTFYSFYRTINFQFSK